MEVAADGTWGSPCVKVYPAAVSACDRVAQARHGRTILVFTHLPKAGGSTLGAHLTASLQKRSPLATCHLLWNGRDRRSTCARIRSWLGRRRAARMAPPLPTVATTAASNRWNASLVGGFPFRHCQLLWAQHADFSLVAAIRARHTQLVVRPLAFVRHPVQLFFAEYLYKRHCLWRQQGLSAPDALTSASLEEHIARLRRSPGQRTLLTRFFAGASWCSCPGGNTNFGGRTGISTNELSQRARANAQTCAHAARRNSRACTNPRMPACSRRRPPRSPTTRTCAPLRNTYARQLTQAAQPPVQVLVHWCARTPQ